MQDETCDEHCGPDQAVHAVELAEECPSLGSDDPVERQLGPRANPAASARASTHGDAGSRPSAWAANASRQIATPDDTGGEWHQDEPGQKAQVERVRDEAREELHDAVERDRRGQSRGERYDGAEREERTRVVECGEPAGRVGVWSSGHASK